MDIIAEAVFRLVLPRGKVGIPETELFDTFHDRSSGLLFEIFNARFIFLGRESFIKNMIIRPTEPDASKTIVAIQTVKRIGAIAAIPHELGKIAVIAVIDFKTFVAELAIPRIFAVATETRAVCHSAIHAPFGYIHIKAYITVF